MVGLSKNNCVSIDSLALSLKSAQREVIGIVYRLAAEGYCQIEEPKRDHKKFNPYLAVIRLKSS